MRHFPQVSSLVLYVEEDDRCLWQRINIDRQSDRSTRDRPGLVSLGVFVCVRVCVCQTTARVSVLKNGCPYLLPSPLTHH